MPLAGSAVALGVRAVSLDGLPGWLLVLAYASLALELTVFALPSEASTLQLFTGDVEAGDVRLAGARQRSRWAKVWCYLLPTAISVALFVMPLIVAVVPALAVILLPIELLVSPVGIWSGLAMIFAGRVLTSVAVFQLRRRHRRDWHDLQPSGLFRVTRNPILVGMYLFYLGNCVWLPSPILWAGFFLYAWNMHQRVLMEEDFLRARMGAAYATYLESVPRYFGWPRRPLSSP